MARIVIDLSLLGGKQGFVIQGDAADDGAGVAVSGAGDINGDGLSDLAIGASYGDIGGTNSGQAYVVFGRAGATRSDIDLASLAATDGFIVRGAAGDAAGYSVSLAGDINGDGYADLIVGAPFDDSGGSYAGQAYVIFGKAGETRSDIDLSSLAAGDGFAITGDTGSYTGDLAGWSVSSAGDANGDGLDDLIVSALFGSDSGHQAGEAYVIFGKTGATRSDIDLGALTAGDGFEVLGAAEEDQIGISVSSAGDVNGDGYDDLIIGSRYADGGGDKAGAAYVIFGKAGATRSNIDLASLAAGDGFVIQGDAVGDRAGYDVSSAGDVNGDGIDDLIVGAPFGDDGGINAGEAYVIFGKAGATRSNIDLSMLTASNGFVIQGDTVLDYAGRAVSAAGDVNGDGIDDLIVGAPEGDDGGVGAGEAYVVFGKAGATRGNVDLSSFAIGDGFIIQGDAAGDDAGWSVSSAGDVNNDGYADLIVGSPENDHGAENAGAAYVIFGSATIGTIPGADDWRLFAGDGFSGEMGGSGAVFGTSAYQNIALGPLPGAVVFDPSFNRGGDVIRFAGDAGEWEVMRSGSSAVFADGDTFVTVPVGTQGLLTVFDDGERLLRFDGAAQTFKIGEQTFTTMAAQITAPAQDLTYPIVEVPDPRGRLFLAAEGSASAGAEGRLEVFGTSSSEEITVLAGDIRLDPSFNRGGDLLVLDQPASAFTAVRSGSSIQLDSAAVDVLIPLGTAGMTIAFADGERTVLFDTGANAALIGDQQIGFTVTALTDFG